MKLLDGSQLADFIKERQAHEVRRLRQAWDIAPKLAIVVTVEHPAIDVYMRMKTRYGNDILVDVETHRATMETVRETIKQLNADESVHGIIVQLPLADVTQMQEVLDLVAPEKDVDGLADGSSFDPATALAILWLLSGYNVELGAGRKIVLVGRGTLVGKPLEKLLRDSGYDVTVVDRKTPDVPAAIAGGDVIITATGVPGLVESRMIKEGAAVVDAGVAGEQGKTVGDLADDVYERQDLTITPKKGGVGPLTVCALFDNVIRAARAQAQQASEQK
ncbi:MAG TPA: bifunctional 5,10-methylenetetrahydrofolate dehydrogenase/5,10-methenyltetrahydrofolate cyclohydrolase [Candidatus Saccharimonadales bacterium]|nr:bifunctional 5,10-methylenetetrahydrofolate dehydrogenase/5,10-methenyltetrahydrofolate cyclohydrolase [Candidatus Saccharimonadales bacterium]